MELRTRILPKMLNSEVEAYLAQNDIIIVPVGTVELHGGLPLDCETVVSEGFAMKMAEACDGLVLTGLPYFYAGATAAGRGTVQVTVREGIDYLMGIAKSLLRQGFKRQIYLSLHGPAFMTCSAMARDFFDETGVPILYMDMSIQIFQKNMSLFKDVQDMHNIMIAGYDIMGRLEDVPLTTEYFHQEPQTCAPFNGLIGAAYASGGVGYYFADVKDHAPTPAIPDAATRQALSDKGLAAIETIVAGMDMKKVVADLKGFEAYNKEVMERCPWVPAAFNAKG